MKDGSSPAELLVDEFRGAIRCVWYQYGQKQMSEEERVRQLREILADARFEPIGKETKTLVMREESPLARSEGRLSR